MDSQPWGPRFKSACYGSYALAEGTLSSLPLSLGEDFKTIDVLIASLKPVWFLSGQVKSTQKFKSNNQNIFPISLFRTMHRWTSPSRRCQGTPPRRWPPAPNIPPALHVTTQGTSNPSPGGHQRWRQVRRFIQVILLRVFLFIRNKDKK